MSKSAAILCVTYVIFLLLGGVIFMNIEWEEHENVITIAPDQWTSLTEMLENPNPPENEDKLTSLVVWLMKSCSNLNEDISPLLTTPGNQSRVVKEVEELCPDLFIRSTEKRYEYPWSFIDAVYFSMTVATTIGYGHISPSTDQGRIACMLYAVFGIPLTGMLLAWTSGFFGERLFQLFKSKLNAERQKSKVFIAIGTLIYIFIGFVVFIFLPAAFFTYIEEEWSYLEGVYYAFITLTTIGFGDLVTGSSMKGSSWLMVYQLCVIFWILIGLGYWVMVANFITRALNSKKIASFARRATDVKKIMSQVGLANNDPQFLSHTSKATLNFMLQLSNAMVAPGMMDNADMASNNTESTTSASSPSHVSHMGIPGIAALFGKAGTGGIGGSSLFDNKMMGMGMLTAAHKPAQKNTSLNVPSPTMESLSIHASSEENLITCNDTLNKQIDTSTAPTKVSSSFPLSRKSDNHVSSNDNEQITLTIENIENQSQYIDNQEIQKSTSCRNSLRITRPDQELLYDKTNTTKQFEQNTDANSYNEHL